MDYFFPLPDDQLQPKAKAVPATTEGEKSSVEIAVEHYFQQYSPATVRAYKTDLQCWWDFCHKDVRESNEHDVLRFVRFLEGEGYKNSSINRKLAALSKVFSIYVSLGLATKNPVQSLASTTRVYKPVDPQVNNVLTKHDVEAVITNSRPGISVIVKFLSNTGLRISEMIGITKSDLEAFNVDFMRVRVLGKGRKVRFVFVSYVLYQEVKKVFDGDSVFLFASRNGKPLSRVNLYKQIRHAFAKHAARPGISCHSLRHFFATEKIVTEKKDYKAVSKYLGHASVATTLNIYSHSQLRPEETQIV